MHSRHAYYNERTLGGLSHSAEHVPLIVLCLVIFMGGGPAVVVGGCRGGVISTGRFLAIGAGGGNLYL